LGSIQKQAIQNTFISYIGVVIGFVNTLILQPKMLSAEELGLTRILYSTSVLIATLFPLGLNAFTIKYFPKFRNSENGHNGYFGFVLLLALIGFAIVSVAVLFLKGNILAKYQSSPLFVEYFKYVFPMSFFIGFISVLYGYSMAIFKTSFPAFLNDVFIRLFGMVIVSLYFLKIMSFPTFIFLSMAALGIQFLLLLIYLFRVDTLSFRVNWPFVKTLEIKKTTQYVFFLSIAALASMAIRNNIDTLFIGSYLDLSQVAVYSVAFLIASLIEVPAGALSKIADPKISDAIARNDFKLIEEVYYKSTRLLMIIGALFFVGLFINIHELLSLLPEKYRSGETAVIIISISAFSNMATGMNSSIIFYSDKYKQGSIMLIAMIILSVILNMIMIPIWGIEGAAIATGTSLFLSNVFKSLIIYRSYKLQPFGRYVFIVLILIGICIGANYFLPQTNNAILDIIYRSAIITLVYAGGIYFSGVAAEETEFVKKLLSR
jgi:O-antigen/teichoic acid export membrane protein